MGFQEFIARLLGSKTEPAKQDYGQRQPHCEEPTGYYTVRGEQFNRAYSNWCADKLITLSRIQMLSVEEIVANLDNRSGYVREFCLRLLMAQDLRAAFKPVVQRLNDYVPINRQLALPLALKWLAELPIGVVVEALPELTAIAEQSRSDHTVVQSAVQQRLSCDEGRNALIAGTSHAQARVRQASWRLCIQFFAWTDEQRIEAAMKSGDPAIARSVEQAVFALPDATLLSMLEKVHQVRAMPLRRAMLVAARRRDLVDDAILRQTALWDASFSIRWLARFWSKDNPEFLIQQYQDAFHGAYGVRRKRFALEGLTELKAPDTLALCTNAFNDNEAAIRKAALLAMCSVNPGGVHNYVRAALADVELSVVRQGFRSLVESGEHLPIETMQAVVNNRSNDLPFFLLLLGYASELSLWPGMHVASLTLLATPALQAELKAPVNAFLAGLALSEVYVTPTPMQWEAICKWQPIEKLNPKSSLRYVMEIYAKRMNSQK